MLPDSLKPLIVALDPVAHILISSSPETSGGFQSRGRWRECVMQGWGALSKAEEVSAAAQLISSSKPTTVLAPPSGSWWATEFID